MAEQHTPTEAQAVPTPGDVAPKPAQTPVEDVTDWKAEARKWEARSKENSAAAARLAELEEAQKTEHQKLTERAEKAERELAEARQESLRSRILADHGIPTDLAHLVAGATEDDLQKAAQSVQKLLKSQASAGAAAVSYTVPEDQIMPSALPLNSSALEDSIRAALQG